MKKIVIFFLSLSIISLLFAETILLKSGKKIQGRIVEKTDNYIKIDFQGVPLTYYLDEIESIDGVTISTVSDNQHKPQEAQEHYSGTAVSKNYEKIVNAVVKIGARQSLDDPYSVGVGFVIRKDGLVVTNYHVVGTANDIMIALGDGTMEKVTKVFNFDSGRDVCILKIDRDNLPAGQLADSVKLERGDTVAMIAIDEQEGYQYLKGEYAFSLQDLGQKYLMAEIESGQEGYSGSPVADRFGKIIGIYSRGNPESSLCSIIPINEVKKYLATDLDLTLNEFKTQSDKSAALVNKGKSYFLKGDYNKAVSYLQQAIEINPNNAEAHRLLASVYTKTHEFNKKIKELETVINIYPNEGQHFIELATVYRNNSMWNEFLSTIKQGLVNNPEYHELYLEFALYYYLIENDLNRAIQKAQKCTDLQPGNCEALTLLIEANGQKRRCDIVRRYKNQMERYGCAIKKTEALRAIADCR